MLFDGEKMEWQTEIHPALASVQIGALDTCCLAYRPSCDALIGTVWEAFSPPSYSSPEHSLSFSHTLTLTTLQPVVSWVTQGGMSSINCGLLQMRWLKILFSCIVPEKRAVSKGKHFRSKDEWRWEINYRLPLTLKKLWQCSNTAWKRWWSTPIIIIFLLFLDLIGLSWYLECISLTARSSPVLSHSM